MCKGLYHIICDSFNQIIIEIYLILSITKWQFWTVPILDPKAGGLGQIEAQARIMCLPKNSLNEPVQTLYVNPWLAIQVLFLRYFCYYIRLPNFIKKMIVGVI